MSNARIETITPDKAKAYLANNNNNRSINKMNLAFLKSEILAGNYQMNGQTIVISTSGKLLDGQHRLTAVVETGLPIESIVVNNVDEDTFVTMDTGKPRGGSDALDIHGVQNSKHIASAIRKIVQRFSHSHAYLDRVRYKISNPEFIKYYDKNAKELNNLYEMTHTWALQGNKVVSESDAMAFIFLLKTEGDEIYDFMEELLTGREINPHSNAAQVLRQKLIRNSFSGHRTLDTERRDLVIHSFRKYKNNHNIKKIMIRNPLEFIEGKKSFLERLVG
jgi:DnaJ-domain-containing protein 1